MGLLKSYRRAADSYIERKENPQAPTRVPLTASQHILHLLLTVFTAGLWLPVWFIRSLHGNPAPVCEQPANGGS